MAAKNLNLAVKLKAIDKLSGPLKNVAGASGQVVDALKKTQDRLKSVDAQTDQFNAFRQLRQQSKETTQSLNQAQAEVKQLAVRMKAASTPIKSLKKDLGAAEQQVAELAQEMKQSKQPSDLLTYQFKEAQKEATRLSKAFKKAERENKSLSKEFEQGKSKVQQLQQAHTKETQKLQQMRQALNKAGVSTKNLSGAQASAKQETNELNQAFDKQAKKLERIAQLEDKAAKSKERMQKSMQVSANMSVAGFGLQQTGQGIQRALGGPMRVAAEFEEKMAGVGAVANASEADLAKLTATSRKLGAETSYSASESADGMKYLAMAGFKTNQIIATMPGLLNLAKAGATDLAAASDISSDILSGFGLNPDQMGRVSDVLTATFTTANTNLGMLGETMKYVAPIARQAGMSLEETSAMAGLLGNVGIKSSQAGTTLRAMITRLAAPTGAAAKTLESLGVETQDASGNMRNMIDVIGDMAAATDGMGSAEKLQALKDVFGEEPAAGMAELLSQEGAQGITKYLDVVTNSQGRAAQIANKMGNNAKGKLKELSSAAESLQITLGNALLPTIKSVSIWLTNVARGVERWAAAHPGLVRMLTITVGAIGALATVGGPLLLAFASLNSIVAITRYGMAAFSAVSKLTAIRMGLVTTAQWAMNTALLANPISLIIVAVVALIAVLAVLIYKYFEPLKAFLGGLWDGFLQGFSPVIDACSGLFTALEPLGAVLSWVWNGVKAVFDWFSQLIQPVESSAASLQSAAGAGVSFGKLIGEALSLVLLPIRMVIGGISLLADLISWVGGVVSSAFGGIQNGTLSFWDVLKTVFEWSPIGLLMKGWGAAFGWIKGKLDWLGGAVDSVKSFFGFGDDEEESPGKSANLTQQAAAANKVNKPKAISAGMYGTGSAIVPDAYSYSYSYSPPKPVATVNQPALVQQAKTAARLEAVKPQVAASQTSAVNKVSTPKAIAAAGMLAAGTIALPAAAEPVQLAPTYQDTVAAYQAPAVSGSGQVTIPSIAQTSKPAPSGSTSITISQLDINVQSAPGTDAKDIAIEVRKQFTQLMHEQQASKRGDLYDA